MVRYRLTYGLLYYKKMNHRATYIHIIDLLLLIYVWWTCMCLVVKEKVDVWAFIL